jgi:class 3 adenylate cyclase
MGYEAAYVVIDGPGHPSTKLALREGITSFGRLPSNDVLLLGDLVSRHHARIIFFDGRASIQDLSSHNGSWVNGEQVTTRALTDGDLVRIGNFNLTFCAGEIEEDADATADAAHHAEARRPENFDGETLGPRLRGPTAFGRPDEVSEPEPLPDHLRSREMRSSPIVDEVERLQSGRSGREAASGTLMLMYRVTEALARASDLTDYLEQVLDYTLERIKCDTGAFYRVMPGETDPIRVAWRTDDERPAQVSMGVIRWALAKAFTVYSQDLGADLRFREGQSVVDMEGAPQAIVCVPILSQDGTLGALYLARASHEAFGESEVDALEAICHLAAAGIERAELRRRAEEESLAREALSRFHSPDVVERILREATDGQGPRRFLEGRSATVCFTDIPGFTSLAERLSPEEISDFLSTYLGQLSTIIFNHRGTIHKLLGDGIVAVFGAPFSYGNDAARAIAAALEMHNAFDRLVAARPALGSKKLRSGLNTGWLLTGTIGSARRLDYALIGETVNTASRIQAAAAPGAILISETTYPLVTQTFSTKKLGLQQVRGRHEPLQIYEVIGRREKVRADVE